MHGVGVENRLIQEIVMRFLARATLPGGGLWGTAEDLLRFGRAMLPGRQRRRAAHPLPGRDRRDEPRADSRHLRHPRRRHASAIRATPWVGESHIPAGIAPSVIDETSAPDGGEVVRVPASPSTFTHGGATGTRLWIDPERELVFVFLTNQWSVSDAAMFSVLREVYTAWDALARSARAPSAT